MRSKPSFEMMIASRSIRPCLETYFFSSSVRRPISLLKLGEIGYSILAEINTQIVAREAIMVFGKFYAPVMYK